MKIIMISLDTLRASRLGCYGYSKPTSPYIDKIAREGVLFERAYAADIPTEVAHTDIFTGKVGLTTGVVSHGSHLTSLSRNEPWLTTLLRDSGLTTAAVDNLYHLKEWFARGYKYYINSKAKTRWIDGRQVTDLAKEWLSQHSQEDFFLFLHYWDPHTPYLPPKEYVPMFYDQNKDPYDPGNASMVSAYNHTAYPFFKHHHFELLGPVTDAEYVNALYDAEIRYLDDLLQELDDYLKQLNIKEETMLILFGDHGESLTEHDIYWDHCGLYETTVNVPLIMRWPERMPQGKRIEGLVQQVDMMPTILEASGIQLPTKLDGKSLWPAINGDARGTHQQIYLSECAWQAARGVVTEHYKFIRTMDSGLFNRPPRELYDLLNDPMEEHNIVEQLPHVVDQLEQDLDAWISEKLQGSKDPMIEQLEKAGLPFKNRIKMILSEVGLTWDEWISNPSKVLFDQKYNQSG
jgi:arylsulfatase A-like enzyme